MYKFNITAKELRKALKYAQKYGDSDHRTITMFIESGEIGNGVSVSNNWDDEEPEDITNYESW